MPRATDWLDFAHRLDKEREAMQGKAPPGVEVDLHLTAYGFGMKYFAVGLRHRESDSYGYGQGRTPAAALAEAKADLGKKLAALAKRPRLVTGEPRAIAAGSPTLFPEAS